MGVKGHLNNAKKCTFRERRLPFKVLNVMLNLKILIYTEDQCMSILGCVLPKIWACSQQGTLQGQKRRFPLAWKSKVWSDSYHTSKLTVICWFPRFCQNNGPNNFSFSGNRLTVTFSSNRAVEGEGAECTIACTNLAPPAEISTGICAQSGMVGGGFQGH